MSAPNIVGVSTITAKTNGLAVTTSATAIVSNASSSNKVVKVNTLIVGNITASAATITVDVYKNQSTVFRIADGISVPADSTIIILDKASSIYLEENDSLRCTAGGNSALEAIVSYEEIS